MIFVSTEKSNKARAYGVANFSANGFALIIDLLSCLSLLGLLILLCFTRLGLLSLLSLLCFSLTTHIL